MKTHTFHASGMHCASCIVLTESELSEATGVRSVKASLTDRRVEVSGDFGDRTPEEIAKELSALLEKHGYTLSAAVPKEEDAPLRGRKKEFLFASLFAAAFLALFVLLQKMGIVNIINVSQVTLPTAFVIGVVASLSTCMAVVGGLVLSVSANFAKGGDAVRPQILFHAGRIVSFFLLGGAIGAAGSVFQFGAGGMFALGIVVSVVMLALGVHLLDIFPKSGWFSFTLPASLGKKVHNLKNINHTLTPFLLGGATFFLPCGFTQSMQLYTLTTGSFFSGAATMLAFALGTLPVLALLSFGSLGILRDKKKSRIFFSAAGIIVIAFALLTLYTNFVSVGILPPLFNL